MPCSCMIRLLHTPSKPLKPKCNVSHDQQCSSFISFTEMWPLITILPSGDLSIHIPLSRHISLGKLIHHKPLSTTSGCTIHVDSFICGTFRALQDCTTLMDMFRIVAILYNTFVISYHLAYQGLIIRCSCHFISKLTRY